MLLVYPPHFLASAQAESMSSAIPGILAINHLVLFSFLGVLGIRQALLSNARLARLAIRLTWRTASGLLSGILLLLLVQAALPPLTLVFSKAVLDRAAVDLGLAGPPDGIIGRFPLTLWIALSAGTLALGQLIAPFSRTMQSITGDRLIGSFMGQMIRAANRWQGIARFEEPAMADDLRRARSEGTYAGLQLMLHASELLLALGTSIAFGITLFRLHPLVPPLLLLAGLPLMATQWSFGSRTRSHLYYKAPGARRIEYSRDMLLRPGPAKDVRLYGLGTFWSRRYERIFDQTTTDLFREQRRMALRVSLAGLLSGLASAGVYLFVIWRITNSLLTPGDLLLYGGAATLLQSRLNQVGVNLAWLPHAFGLYLPALDRVLNAPPDLPLSRSPQPVPRNATTGIAFEDVHFTYPGTATPVLRGVSLSIAPGEGLALVGHNGSGKTTIVKLMLRMYDPSAGRITLDGVDLREYDIDELRAAMGVIFQDFVRYELSARENIGLGQLDSLDDDARLLDAAQRAGATGLLSTLPDGLDTRLGREFGGRELSGGEWQKLALARAFIRDCRLLVLDEPTAALDVQTEYDVYTRFWDLTRGRMTVLISHRFSTVRMADRILFLQDGRIQEQGSHAELMRQEGAYARLYQLQASQYLEQST